MRSLTHVRVSSNRFNRGALCELVLSSQGAVCTLGLSPGRSGWHGQKGTHAEEVSRNLMEHMQMEHMQMEHMQREHMQREHMQREVIRNLMEARCLFRVCFLLS